jgi:hypothetical protein
MEHCQAKNPGIHVAVGLKIDFACPEPATALALGSAWLPRSGSAVSAQCWRLEQNFPLTLKSSFSQPISIEDVVEFKAANQQPGKKQSGKDASGSFHLQG